MPQSRPLTAISRPITAMQAVPPPIPLDAEMYRPRGTLAALLFVTPAALALVLILLVRVTHADRMLTAIILGVGAALLLGGLAAVLTVGRVLFITVRATIEGIEARTLRDERIVLRWKYIDDVSHRFGLLHLRSSDNKRITLLEGGLTDGQQLLRQVLLRVSPTVLSPALEAELKELGGSAHELGTTQRLPIARAWVALGLALAVGGVALIGLGVLLGMLPWLVPGGALILLGAILLVVCRQQILINSQEITLITPLGRARTLLWTEIALIETLPLGIMLRLRGAGDQRLTVLGPFFLAPLRAEALAASLDYYLTQRGVMTYRRWGMR